MFGPRVFEGASGRPRVVVERQQGVPLPPPRGRVGERVLERRDQFARDLRDALEVIVREYVVPAEPELAEREGVDGPEVRELVRRQPECLGGALDRDLDGGLRESHEGDAARRDAELERELDLLQEALRLARSGSS